MIDQITLDVVIVVVGFASIVLHALHDSIREVQWLDASMIKLPTLECKRCNHRWHPKQERLPVRCPRCGSPYWAKPRKNSKETMRKATLSLALFFAAISSQAAIVYKNFSQPVSFQFFVSCANSGQGELVDFTGAIDTTLAVIRGLRESEKPLASPIRSLEQINGFIDITYHKNRSDSSCANRVAL